MTDTLDRLALELEEAVAEGDDDEIFAVVARILDAMTPEQRAAAEQRLALVQAKMRPN